MSRNRSRDCVMAPEEAVSGRVGCRRVDANHAGGGLDRDRRRPRPTVAPADAGCDRGDLSPDAKELRARLRIRC